ncbi:MAG: hypothetical protein JNK82_22390 [Myxococcaceae bacterium]|nr:hypothetical protein [Myxococcaceae bacterium]
MKRITLVLLLAACPKEKSSAPEPGPAPAPVAQAEEASFTLTPKMLDAYLGYQRAWVGKGAPEARPLDRAAREQAALKASGLTEKQVNTIDAMVSAVIARRMISQLTGNPAFNPDFGAMNAAMSPEQKKHMEDAMAMFKAQQQAANDLTDERQRYGSHNIDVLLTQEAELSKVWSDMMGLGAYANVAGVPPSLPAAIPVVSPDGG